MVYTAENMPDGFTMTEFMRNMNKFIVKPKDSITDITEKIGYHLNGVPGIDISMVVAGFDQDVPYVYLIENEDITLINKNIGGEIIYGAINGGNLKRIDKIFDYEKEYQNSSINDVLDYGLYLINDSIEYLNKLNEYSNVGGGIQRLVINKSGGVSLVRE